MSWNFRSVVVFRRLGASDKCPTRSLFVFQRSKYVLSIAGKWYTALQSTSVVLTYVIALKETIRRWKPSNDLYLLVEVKKLVYKMHIDEIA